MADHYLSMSRIEMFLKWYKKLQKSQKTGFVIAVLSLVVLPTVIVLNAQVTENRSQAKYPSEETPPVSETCKVTGCYDQVCTLVTAKDIIATCEWRPKYACTQYTRCEKQSNGGCGWAQTPAYTQCLTDATKSPTP